MSRAKRKKTVGLYPTFLAQDLGINDNKYDKNYNSTNTRKSSKCNTRSNRIWKVKVKLIGDRK